MSSKISTLQNTSLLLVDFINIELIPKINKFRTLQDTTGRVIRDKDMAHSLLEEMKPIVRYIYFEMNKIGMAKAFEKDVQQWQAQGLDSIPNFINSQATYVPPQDGEQTFFIAPFLASNGPVPTGHFLECFLALREEPTEFYEVAARFPHPHNISQSARIITGSSGLMLGNCLVFFPENVVSDTKVHSQNFALFFYNKFYSIYLYQTMPRVKRITNKKDWSSTYLTPGEFYRVRSTWGYLHDYFHHTGSRPLNTNLQIKLNQFASALEELKVDCLTSVTSYTEDIPFGHEIIEFILFERMFRYPSQPDGTVNGDAASGIILFEWLLQKGAISGAKGHLEINLKDSIIAMQSLASKIESLERIQNDEEFLLRAREFVRLFLPEGEKGQWFSVPKNFNELVGITPQKEIISFANLPY